MGWGSQVQVWGLPTYCAASRASMVVQGRLGWLWPLPLYILWPSPHPPGAGHGGPPQKSPRGGVWIAQPSGHVAGRVGLGAIWIWGSPPLGMKG